MSNEELVKLYQQGDRGALEELIELNRGIVTKLVNKFYIDSIGSIDKEDLEQEGYIGLMIAADKYNLNNPKKAKFITYAVHWIYQRIRYFIKKRINHNEGSLYTPIAVSENSELIGTIMDEKDYFSEVNDQICRIQLRRELDSLMENSTTLKERTVIKLYYGWDAEPTSIKDIADIYNTTIKDIGKCRVNAINKLRKTKWFRYRVNEKYYMRRVKKYDSEKDLIKFIDFKKTYYAR